MIEMPDPVNRTRARLRPAALAKPREDRHVRADGIVESDFRRRVLLVADDDYCPRDVFEAAVLDPQLVGIARIDFDGGGEIAERVADQGQARHVFADRGVALTLEDGIDERELPERRRVVRQDSVAAAI